MASSGTPPGPFPAGTDPDDYDRLRRRVLWMMPSGLYLLGSRAGGTSNLMTLNWAMQVSTDPKLVAVSVEVPAVTHRLIDEGGVFALSLLERADRSVVRRFVKPATPGPEEGQLNGFAVRAATTGAPILAQASAWLDCEVTARQPCGSHTLFLGQVVDAGINAPSNDGASSNDRAGQSDRASSNDRASQGGSDSPAAQDGPAAEDGAAAEDGKAVGETGILRMEDTRMSYGG